jgi:hypothetical protein
MSAPFGPWLLLILCTAFLCNADIPRYILQSSVDDPSVCLEALDAYAVRVRFVGAELAEAPCRGRVRAQQFIYQSENSTFLLAERPTLCLDVRYGLWRRPALTLFRCKSSLQNGANQQFLCAEIDHEIRCCSGPLCVTPVPITRSSPAPKPAEDPEPSPSAWSIRIPSMPGVQLIAIGTLCCACVPFLVLLVHHARYRFLHWYYGRRRPSVSFHSTPRTSPRASTHKVASSVFALPPPLPPPPPPPLAPSNSAEYPMRVPTTNTTSSEDGVVSALSFSDRSAAPLPRPLSYLVQPEQAVQLPIRWTPPRATGIPDFEAESPTAATGLRARPAEWYRTHT